MSKLSMWLFGKNKPREPDSYSNDPTALNLITNYLQSISGYSTVYSTPDAGLYEISLCRACIHRKATETSKVLPKLAIEDAKIYYIIAYQPNPMMNATQFYYRLRTIYEVENNAFIIPIENKYGEIVGLFPIARTNAEIKLFHDELYVFYQFGDGEWRAIPYSKCGHLKKMQYEDDFYGSSNKAFTATANLEKAIEDASMDAINKNRSIEFMAQINRNLADESELKKQQESLDRLNMSQGNKSKIFVFDSRWSDIQQIKPNTELLDAEQKAAIDNSVYTYWGTNEAILQNKYTEDEWNAFYESELEPFFLQLAHELTKIFFTRDERMSGHTVSLTSDRLQYASNTTKIALARDLLDRGVLNRNEVREILNMQSLGPKGDEYVIRSEYVADNAIERGNDDGNTTDAVKIKQRIE